MDMEKVDICSNGEGGNETISPMPINDSPRKCNLSFSFNFDFDDVNSDNSSDSETAALQIDVSEVDNYEPSSKHKREADKETSVLNEMEEEIERQLDATAAKVNLTATNVKNILKHVITNEHVMAMVRKRLHDSEEDLVFEPKLTRAKAKELAASQGNIPWPITPIKKASSGVQVLIEEELSEDSSDEEYNPEQDKQSDDEREVENFVSSDVDSQPSTLTNLVDTASHEQHRLTNVQYDPEGIFKIPGIPHVVTEEESIGQRTRSKLCLSETSLEQIEQAFIPPDITTDMYDWDCEVDEDWNNFLKEFTQPLKQDPAIEDDPEADPEYNILDDEETDLLDKEELRADKAVKVTRKELNNLIAELFEFTDTFSTEQQEVSRKKKPSDNLNSSVENNSLNCSMVDLLPVLAEPELPKLVNPEQRQLLAIQFRQHVQLMTQHFAMTYMHPELHSQSKTCKENLNSLRYLSNGPNSAFNAENLSDALKLVSDWESKFLDSKFQAEYKEFLLDEEDMKKIYRTNRWCYVSRFHPELQKLFMESKALMYPQLLPLVPFRSQLDKCVKSPYLKSEENLLALGLEQFLPFVSLKQRKFKSKKIQLVDAVQLIIQYLLPCRESRSVLNHIKKCRIAKTPNPIKHYFQKGVGPKIIHYISLECNLKAPKDQPLSCLPLCWQSYFNNETRTIDLLKRKHIINTYSDLVNKNHHEYEKIRMYCNISDKHPLRNPVVNILPKILPNRNVITSESNTVKDSCHEKHNSNPVTSKTSNTISKGNESLNNGIQNSEHCSVVNKECVSFQPSTLKSKHIEVGDTKNVKENERTGTGNYKVLQARNTKGSRKSSEILHQIPQLRETTPRLAKIRSAQNMKLMTQVSGQKNVSNSNSVKSRGKVDTDKNQTNSPTVSTVDNEEEIAELMLASTTIKKDSLTRKKAKQARELENIKRLLEADNPLHEEERASKFAASYLQKLHLILEPRNPEVFRAVIKLYLDYNEKVESINQLKSGICFSTESESTQSKDSGAMNDNWKTKDSLAINLYQSICEKLKDYPELCSDLLLFLKPHQAAMSNKLVDYMMLQKMNEFVNVAQTYFAKQPSRLAKMMQAITQLSSDPYVTLETVHTVMGPIFKGHPLVMDLFLQTLPSGKPPESLFAPHMFETLSCPVGPYDKHKVYTEDAPELYETIDLPVLTPQDDPYGGDNCKCNCHNVDETNNKSNTEHCVSCGIRFLNGRIYLHTSEGLRPAKITFPGSDQEQLENIARVSLKTTDKFIPAISSKQRRKSSKNDGNHDEPCQKQCSMKNSPMKDNDENEKVVAKTKRGIKSPTKSSEQKKPLKRLRIVENEEITVKSKRMRATQYKGKRERKNEKREAKLDETDVLAPDITKTDETTCLDPGTSSMQLGLDITNSDSDINIKRASPAIKHDDSNLSTDQSKMSTSLCSTHDNEEKVHESVKCNYIENSQLVSTDKPWARQEDMILLQCIKEEYSEKSFLRISEKLGNRTVAQVKDRCETLLSLLEKMS